MHGRKEWQHKKRDTGERGDEGELKLLRSKGPDPHGMSSKGCVSGDRCQEKSGSQMSHSLPMSTDHDQYPLKSLWKCTRSSSSWNYLK